MLGNKIQMNNPMSSIMQVMKSQNPQQMAMNMLRSQNPQAYSQLENLMNSGATPQQVMQNFGISENQINEFKQMMGNNIKI